MFRAFNQLGLADQLISQDTTTDAGSSSLQLFKWTLTHQVPSFSQIEPVFSSEKGLEAYVKGETEKSQELNVVTAIIKLAETKIEHEWNRWSKVHEDYNIDHWKLDNRLMSILYRFIRERDDDLCVICGTSLKLDVHHIIRKRRGSLIMSRFGRSVPTNLVTLCRDCHAKFHIQGS